jgi:peptidyl-dipeptidase Dcp
MYSRLATAALLTAFVSCAHTPDKQGAPVKDPAPPTQNPLLGDFSTPFGVPPFDAIRTEHFMPALRAGIAEQLRAVKAIVNDPAPPDFDNTVAALDYSGLGLTRTARVFRGLFSADTNDAMDKLAEQITPLLTAHRDQIMLDPGLFARLKQVHDKRASLKLTPEQRTLLEEYHVQFVRSGAELDVGAKEQLKRLNKELALAMLQFSQNVRKEDNGFALTLEQKEDLAGLPARVVEAAAKAAQERGQQGKWVFTLHKPSLLPFLQHSSRRELRERLFTAYIRRGANGNAQDNRALIKTIMTLRIKKANMLGAKTWADFALQRRMAKTPTAARGLLDRVWTAALPAAKREVAAMQKLIDRTEKKRFALQPWDWWYYAEKVRQAKYDLDDGALRPYFKLDNVLQGAFWVATRLYGLAFVQRKDLPVYHPEVQTYEVKEADGRHVGLLYVDYFPRKSKRGGAWCGGFREQMQRGGKRVAPIVTNVGNFTRPTDKQPSLLSLEEVRTLFHEFGHALHSLLNRTTYPTSAEEIKVDFVELPSQIMENWAVEPEVLRRYAKHFETGKPMPAALIDKLSKARHFNQGFETVEYVAASYLDLAWHELASLEGVEVDAHGTKAMKAVKLIPEIEPRYLSSNFRHIFSSGYYAAGYYSYLWAQVLDADAFAVFKAKGLFDKETARAFRALLEQGGSEDPMALYKRFRGAEPSVEPLLKRRGLK